MIYSCSWPFYQIYSGMEVRVIVFHIISLVVNIKILVKVSFYISEFRRLLISYKIVIKANEEFLCSL